MANSSYSQIRSAVLNELMALGVQVVPNPLRPIPVGISARHVHLTQSDLEQLFGTGYQLQIFKPLSQPGQFAAQETVSVIGPKGRIEKIRILGPVRSASQVEMARSDLRALGANAPVRSSGKISGTPGIILKGPIGQIELKEGLIIADRHIHMNETEASQFGVYDGEVVEVKVPGPRGGVLDQVVIRVRSDFALDCHLDTDDANALQIEQGQTVFLIKKK